jgi:hypothetical protein
MHIHAPSGRANSTSVSVGEVVGHGIDGVMSTNAGDVSAPALAEVTCRAIRCFLRSVGLNRRRFATRPLDKTVLKATACSQRSSGMRACPLRRARRQRSKRLANSVKAASAGVSIGIDLGSISQIDQEMKVYLRSTTFQMSRTLTGSTRVSYHKDHVSRLLKALEWTPQRPLNRASQRDERKIKRWRTNVWPELKKSAPRAATDRMH